ncbi:MAG: hypothetical protein ACLU4N_21810 [Butyricimonas faecihominis]
MTEEAKTVFANAVVYISQFAGQTPIARKYDDGIIRARWLADVSVYSYLRLFRKFVESGARIPKMMEQMKQTALEKQSKEELNSLEQMCLNYRASEPRSYEENLQERFPELYLHSVRTRKGMPITLRITLIILCRNRELRIYHRRGCRSLGISNKDPRILDQAICLMEEGRMRRRGTLAETLHVMSFRDCG